MNSITKLTFHLIVTFIILEKSGSTDVFSMVTFGHNVTWKMFLCGLHLGCVLWVLIPLLEKEKIIYILFYLAVQTFIVFYSLHLLGLSV
jgi:hypothetical protein